MTDHGVRIYFDLGLIRIKGVYAPLLSDKHVSTVVRILRAVTLLPNTAYVLNAKVKSSQKYTKGSECLVSSIDNSGIVLNEPALEIRDSVIKLSSSNKLPVEIVNHNNRCIRLKKGRILGRLEVIDSVNVSAVNYAGNDRSSRNGSLGHRQDSHKPSREEILGQIHTEEEHRSEVENLVMKNIDCFAFSEKDIVPSNLVTMNIELTDETPFKIRPYRAAADDQKAIDQTVSEWLAAGIVSRSRSPFSSSVVVVNKKDGEKRVCVDFRKLNAVTKAYVIRLPSIDEILSKLGGAKYISTFDLKSGFFNVPLNKKSREYTSFTTLKGQFAFNRAPFGLRNSPSYFVELMQLALDGLDDICTFYVDDVIVWSSSLEEHLKHIDMLFKRLRKHSLKLKLKKSQFMKAESQHLGFIVTPSGVKPDPEKVEAIKTPTNVKECRSFVALCSYYRRFVPNFAKISEPIVALTKNYARFKWTEKAQKAFEYMKESLTVIPLLAYPDLSKRFILYTDASDTATGACLVQEHEENGEVFEKPLYFLSHKLSPTQCRWSTVEKECWAIHHALQKLHSWISCSQILVRTDHQPLRYIINSDTGSFNRKINSWALTIASYNIDVEYLPGRANVVADLMSRKPTSSTQEVAKGKQVSEQEPELKTEVKEEPLQVNHIDSSKLDTSKYLNLEPPLVDVEEKPTLTELDTREEQKLDENITLLKKNLEAGKLNKSQDKSLIIMEDILYFISDVEGSPKLRLYLPEHLVDVMIRGYHDNSHLGIDKVYDSMKRKYYCPNMYKRVSESILPIDSILKSRERYTGDEVHKLALEKQHESFMLVHKHLREAKKKSARRFDENADDAHFKVGDPVYVKNHTRKSKLDNYASGFYRIVEQKSPFTFKVRNQLDGTVLDKNARHMRHAKIDSWKITKQEKNRKLRRARYVISPSSDTEPQAEQEPLDKLVQMKKQHRSGSSDEEDIPKLELTKRIIFRQRRLKRESAESGSYSSDNDDSSSSGSDKKSRHYGNVASDTDHSNRGESVPMDIYEKQEQNHYSSDTEEYFSAGDFERNQRGEYSIAEDMDVDNVTRRKHTRSRTRQKVKR